MTPIEICTIITGVIGSATLIFRGLLILTKFTGTEKDDKIVGKILRVFELLSMNVGKIKNEIVIQTRSK